MATFTVCSKGETVKVSADHREVVANAARALKEARVVTDALRDATYMLRQIAHGETFPPGKYWDCVLRFEQILSRAER